MSIVQQVQSKSVVNCQATKNLVSTTVKSAQLALTCSTFRLRNNNFFGDNDTHCFEREMSRDNEREKPTPLLKKILRQSQSSLPKSVP